MGISSMGSDGHWARFGAGKDNGGDGNEDDDHAGEFGGGEALAEEGDADEHGDDRVDEGVGGDLGDGDVLQQVGVGGEADDRSEGGEIEDGEQAAARPVAVRKQPPAVAMVRLTTPAAPICQAVATKVSTRKWKRREMTEPKAKASAAPTRRAKPKRLRRSGAHAARCSAGQSRTTIPAAPSSVPSQPRRFRVSPPGSAVSMTATRMGTMAMISEDKPEATLVSPQISRRLLTVIMRTPTSARRQRCAGDAQAGAARQADAADDNGGDQRARGADQRRREMQAGDVNGAVGRAPEKIHAGEGDRDAGFCERGTGICS